MNKLKILSCAGAVALTGFVEIALAVGAKDPTRRHPFQHFLLETIARLNVSDSQKQQIHAILRQARPTLQPPVAQYMQERRGLRKVIHTAPVNEQLIRARAGRVAQIEADLAVKRAHVSERIRTVLT